MICLIPYSGVDQITDQLQKNLQCWCIWLYQQALIGEYCPLIELIWLRGSFSVCLINSICSEQSEDFYTL